MKCIVNTKLSSVVRCSTDQLLFPRMLGNVDVYPCRLGCGAFVIDAREYIYTFVVSSYVCLTMDQLLESRSMP